MKRILKHLVSLVTVLVLVLLCTVNVFADSTVGAELWGFYQVDDLWTCDDDGSITHLPDDLPADFAKPLDFSKSFSLSMDFAYDRDACIEEGCPRPTFQLQFHSPTGVENEMLAINVIGPDFATENDNTWLVEPSFNNGKAWLQCNIERLWTPATWGDVAHFTIEKAEGDTALNLSVTVGETTIMEGNMYIKRRMDAFLNYTDMIMTINSNFLETCYFTMSNIKIENGGVTLYECTGGPTTTTPAPTTTTTVEGATTTTESNTDTTTTLAEAGTTTANGDATTTVADTATTTGTKATQASTDPGEGDSAWVWILVAVLVVAAAGIGVAAVVILKKKKAS